MSRKHYKTKNYLYAKGARKRYAHVVPAATMATASTVSTAGTKLSVAEQFDCVAAVSTADVAITTSTDTSVKATDVPAAKLPVSADLTPVTVSPADPQTLETETEPVTDLVPEEPAAIRSANRSGNRTKWILLVVAAVVLFLFLRKK